MNDLKQKLIAFEQRIADLFCSDPSPLPFLIHLSGGNEDQLIEWFSHVQPGDWVFSTHRNHYHYLLTAVRNGITFEDAADKLEALIRDGKSMFVYDRSINFCCSAILGGTTCIAAGVAWDIARRNDPQHVWCFFGDGAEDNGHCYEAIRFVQGRGLPCTFIIEDNDRSVDTNKLDRRGGSMSNFWDGYGCVKRYEYKSAWPHGGAGCKTMVKFDPAIVDKYRR